MSNILTVPVHHIPVCRRCTNKKQRRACRGVTMARHRVPWPMIAERLGYARPDTARKSVLWHLDGERPG